MRRIKGFGKKILSSSLALVMLLSVGFTTVYAAEDTIQVNGQDIISETENTEDTTSEETTFDATTEDVVTEETVSTEELESEEGNTESTEKNESEVGNTESTEKNESEVGNIESTEKNESEVGNTESIEELSTEESSVDAEENGIEETILLNYMILEKDYVETPSTQYVVADVGDDNTIISEAVLTYNNITTGAFYQKEVDTILGGTMLFDLSFTSEQAGQYQITTLDYKVNDEVYTINVPETGAAAIFGVDTKVDVEPYAWIFDEEHNTEDTEKCDELAQMGDSDNCIEISDAESAEQLTSSLFSLCDSNMNNLTGISSSGNLVVVLDPGHGGTDPGAARTWNGVNYTERDINLKIAQSCKAELENYDDITVYLTRTDNTTSLSLTDRTNYAKSVGADVFISIHINSTSSTATTVTGAEVIIPNASYNTEIHNTANDLGNIILNKLAELGITNRGTWSRDTTIGEKYPDGTIADYYTVIYNSKMNGMPGIIVEHAYVSNEADCINFLSSDEKLRQIGIQDAMAIAEYYNLSSNSYYVYNGVDYSAVYDYDYYINHYPDLKSAYEGKPQKALAHFVNYGMEEGRQGCADFNVTYYKNRYVDLRNTYGNNLKNYYMHFINHGQKEGRDGKTPSVLVGVVTKLDGIDYSAVYDFNYYVNTYSNIKEKYSNDDVGALQYFVTYGMEEGQQAIATFNVTSYAYGYYDLRKAYKNDLVKYYLHYINHGKEEGRVATGTITMRGGLTTYGGADYSAVYNVGYYANKYADLRNAYGLDDEAYLRHFVEHGMQEGRQGSNSFSVTSYRYQYQDLRIVYGMNYELYYLHYVNNGKAEGRKGTGTTSLQNPVTTLNGVDYSAVYDYNFYIASYADIRNAYGGDDLAVLKHFVEHGMQEGRQGSNSFSVTSYRYQYQDLRIVYGMNYELYYLHYVNNGKAEGRKGTGTTSLQNPVTILNGVDYSAVYDYNSYIASYADIRNAYGGDDLAVLKHFVEHGMQEGRQGNAEFIVAYYKSNYVDLQRGFGDDLNSYYLHYINDGKKEGRIANKLLYYSIMGTSTVTVDQMVAYYNAHATYPSFYANSDAPNIRTFCQLYLDECNAEGVKAQVAFCQAMLETGFLSYGGDVNISQYNFAGLGATGGVPGLSFSSVREGIRAQVQHLKAYASTESLNNTCIDPRFGYVTRGCAPYIEWLGIQENPNGYGWASAQNYGYIIKNNYIYSLLRY